MAGSSPHCAEGSGARVRFDANTSPVESSCREHSSSTTSASATAETEDAEDAEEDDSFSCRAAVLLRRERFEAVLVCGGAALLREEDAPDEVALRRRGGMTIAVPRGISCGGWLGEPSVFFQRKSLPGREMHMETAC
jgi:hypothetical protein